MGPFFLQTIQAAWNVEVKGFIYTLCAKTARIGVLKQRVLGQIVHLKIS
jgi:hypothetical protein